MEDENQKLKERLSSVQTTATSALSEKDRLKNDLVAASSATSRDSGVGDGEEESSSGVQELASLQAKIEQLQTQLSEVTAGRPCVHQPQCCKYRCRY